MAKETTTRLIDDIDGGAAEKSVTFAVDGHSYAIDLSKKNVAAFEKALKPYIAAARPVRSSRSARATVSSRRRRPAAGGRGSAVDLQVVREWARANGHEVSDRGRIASSVLEAYQEAN